jgi:hypothetical protein
LPSEIVLCQRNLLFAELTCGTIALLQSEASMPFDPAKERRGAKRRRVDEPATIEHESRAEKCLVRDISARGVQLILETPPAPDTEVGLMVPPVGFLTAYVKWRNGNRAGAAFRAISPAAEERIRRI